MAKISKKSTRRTASRRRRRSSTPTWLWSLLGGSALLLIGLLVVALAVKPANAPQASAELAPPEVLAQGETIFNETCAACHGANGEGNVGPALDGSMHAWHHVDNQLRSFIGDGIPGTAMVGHKDHLTATEIEAVISYMKAWWTPEQREMQLTGRHPMP